MLDVFDNNLLGRSLFNDVIFAAGFLEQFFAAPGICDYLRALFLHDDFGGHGAQFALLCLSLRFKILFSQSPSDVL